jgi:hypothetical protein
VFEPNEIEEAQPPLDSAASFFWRRRSDGAKAPHFSSAEAFFAYFFSLKKVRSRLLAQIFSFLRFASVHVFFSKEKVYGCKNSTQLSLNNQLSGIYFLKIE